MRRMLFKAICLLSIGVFATSCGKDNYDAPASTLSGKIVYNGNPIGVRGSNSSVKLQLWQDGFDVKTPIDVFITQDGSFSSALFDGKYKLITVSGNGPWKDNADTVFVDVHGDTQIDFPVTPYCTIDNISYQVNGNELTASLSVKQIDGEREIEDINLFVNDTQFVDIGHATKRESSANINNGVLTLKMDITDELKNRKALFARVGVRIKGITEAVYDSRVEKIK